MRHFLWLLIKCLGPLLCSGLLACEPPQHFDDSEDDMAKRYPTIQEAPDRGLPQVAVVTARTGGWSGDNQLGYQAKYGPDQRGMQTILKLDEWGPPEVWTLRFYVKQSFKLFNGFGITAIINYGAGGSTQTVEIDWLNGTEISLPMNAVNVVARFDNIDVTTEGAGLVLGVQIARGARGGTKLPIKTIVQNQDFTTGTFAWNLPAFARRVILIPDSSNDAAGKAALYNANTYMGLQSRSADAVGSAIIVNYGNQAYPGGTLELPVIGEARSVIVSNPIADNFGATIYAEIDG